MYKCPYCDAIFDEQEQTRSQYRDGVCPHCGGDGVIEVRMKLIPATKQHLRNMFRVLLKRGLFW